MLFGIFMTFGIFLAVKFALCLPFHWVFCMLIGILTYSFFVAAAGGLTVVVSMLLGKSGQTHLKKSRHYFVKSRDESYTYLYSGDGFIITVPNSEIAETHIDTSEQHPYMMVDYYNIGGWRRWLLVETYKDKPVYTLYLPSEDGT